MKQSLAALLLLMLLLTAQPAFSEEEPMPLQHESGVFSMDSARFALRVASPQTAEDAQVLFDDAGFTVLLQANYDKPISDHSHTSAYTVASGEATIRGEERALIIITIRGTADGEWYSNFDFAAGAANDCAYAENFYEAAQAIFAAAKPEIDAVKSPVVFVTGYSRGGACANLVGVMLDEQYGSEDVYTYTFATPNTVRTAKADYPNIFNIVNMNDTVTRIPLAGWGFRRAGVDIELRDPDLTNPEMHYMILSLLGICPDIASYYTDRHSLTGSGLSEDGITIYELFASMSAAFTGGADTTDAQALFQKVLTSQNDMAEFFALFMGTSEGSSFLSQHNPTIYIELMEAYQE